MNKVNRALLLCLTFLLFHKFGQSQMTSRMISGVIISSKNGEPLEGASVQVKGKEVFSGSQADGIYYINVNPEDSVLIFSCENCLTKEVKIGSNLEFSVNLNPQNFSTLTNNTSLNGKWRGVFYYNDSVQVPFQFDIESDNIKGTKLYFLNAEERFEGGRLDERGDSLFINLDAFDNVFVFKASGENLEGYLRKQDGTGNNILVKAKKGEGPRFDVEMHRPIANLNGKYDIYFKGVNGSDEHAVGVFKQEGNTLRATFLRITGDSRYLDGVITGDQFYLSSFIGSGPSYYTGKILPDGTIQGKSGVKGIQVFRGTKNIDADLPDVFSLTSLKEGLNTIDFSFPDLFGNKVSLKDEKFKQKVVIVTIGGTWCPNCMDENAFLSEWYKKNRQRGVEIVSLQYERNLDSAYLQKVLQRFKKRFDIQYDQLIAGKADKDLVLASLPALKNFVSFPTTLFIDKNGVVRKIHTGFSGPATGAYYTNFINEFNATVDELLGK